MKPDKVAHCPGMFLLGLTILSEIHFIYVCQEIHCCFFICLAFFFPAKYKRFFHILGSDFSITLIWKYYTDSSRAFLK